MPNCAIINCKNSSKKINRGNGDVSYHRFPRDPSIRDKWIKTTGRPDWFPKQNSTLCSEHFDEKYFCIKPSGNKFLRDTAVPEKKIVCFQFDVSKQEGYDKTKSESELSRQINESEIDSDEECLENIREKAKREAYTKNSPSTKYNEQRLVQLLRWNEDKVKKQNMKIKQLMAKNRRLKIKINNILGGESGDRQQVGRIGLAIARKDSSSDQEEKHYNIYQEIKNETYLQAKINKLKENSKTEFKTFGSTIAEYLNSISLEPAVILQARLEADISRFKSDLKKSNNLDQFINRTRDNHKGTNKKHSIVNASNTKQSLLNSTNEIFSRTINRLAHIDDVNLSIDKQIIKVNSSTDHFIAYCIQPKLSGKTNKVAVVENADNLLLELNKNGEEIINPGKIHEIEVKIEENDVIVKLEDETSEQTYNDPLNTG